MERELLRYRDDAKSLATAPFRWDAHEWQRFAEGTAVVASMYTADRPLYDRVQEHRSSGSIATPGPELLGPSFTGRE